MTIRNPDICFDYAQQLAAGLARITNLPAHVVNDQNHLIICDDRDIATWGTDDIVYTVEPEMAFSAAELGDEVPTDNQDVDSTPDTYGPEQARCAMNVLGTHWSICGAPADGPCYCDVIVRATPQIPLYDDIARVLDMTLGQTHGAASIVSELRRVRARLQQVQECAIEQR